MVEEAFASCSLVDKNKDEVYIGYGLYLIRGAYIGHIEGSEELNILSTQVACFWDDFRFLCASSIDLVGTLYAINTLGRSTTFAFDSISLLDKKRLRVHARAQKCLWAFLLFFSNVDRDWKSDIWFMYSGVISSILSLRVKMSNSDSCEVTVFQHVLGWLWAPTVLFRLEKHVCEFLVSFLSVAAREGILRWGSMTLWSS